MVPTLVVVNTAHNFGQFVCSYTASYLKYEIFWNMKYFCLIQWCDTQPPAFPTFFNDPSEPPKHRTRGQNRMSSYNCKITELFWWYFSNSFVGATFVFIPTHKVVNFSLSKADFHSDHIWRVITSFKHFLKPSPTFRHIYEMYCKLY